MCDPGENGLESFGAMCANVWFTCEWHASSARIASSTSRMFDPAGRRLGARVCVCVCAMHVCVDREQHSVLEPAGRRLGARVCHVCAFNIRARALCEAVCVREGVSGFEFF